MGRMRGEAICAMLAAAMAWLAIVLLLTGERVPASISFRLMAELVDERQ